MQLASGTRSGKQAGLDDGSGLENLFLSGFKTPAQVFVAPHVLSAHSTSVGARQTPCMVLVDYVHFNGTVNVDVVHFQ